MARHLDPAIVFGLYHTAGLISHRMLAMRRPPSPDEGLRLKVPKAAAMFTFFAFSLPLMVITANKIIPVYSALLGMK